jgi:DNA (cytosine-5)-methyltransferase 1
MARGDTLRLNDWFCGAGGATQGAHAVPGIVPVLAANHDQLAIETHSTNFPDVEHFRGDIRDLDVARHPYAEIFWASPECTNWSQAKGKPVDFDAQPGLFGDPEIADDVARSRALMQDVIRYLEGMHLRQRPVLAGVVENVVDIRKWEHWLTWRGRIERLGYRTRLIALNSMHAQAVRTPRAPQSRDRLYLAYWHESIGRDPDWDRWLRPSAWCPSCEQTIAAVQVWRRPGNDMGRYGQQYDYRCPKVSCRGQLVEPTFVPAAAAIDWSLPGTRIGDRARPLATKTRARIAAGARRYARPVVLEAGGNQYDSHDPKHKQHGNPDAYSRVWPADTEPLKTLHTALTKAVAIPPLLIPVEGRVGKQASDVHAPMRTQTARNETGVVIPSFVSELRGGGSVAHTTDEALATVTASGNHHGLVIPPLVMRNNTARGDQGQMSTPAAEAMRTITTAGHQSLLTWGALYAHDAGVRDLARPMPTQTTIQGDALLTAAEWDAVVDDCLFRMLEPHEIHAGMAFVPDYVVLGSKRQKVKQLGNAVTPPSAEVLVAALVECITGTPLDLEQEAA